MPSPWKNPSQRQKTRIRRAWAGFTAENGRGFSLGLGVEPADGNDPGGVTEKQEDQESERERCFHKDDFAVD